MTPISEQFVNRHLGLYTTRKKLGSFEEVLEFLDWQFDINTQEAFLACNLVQFMLFRVEGCYYIEYMVTYDQ